MEITYDYSKLCQKIWELRNEYYRRHRGEPNVTYVGYDELDILKDGDPFHVENGQKDRKDYTIFGMKLKRVTEDSYCAVGLVIK